MHILIPLQSGFPIPNSGAADDRVGRFGGIILFGRFRDEVLRSGASDIKGSVKFRRVGGVLGNSKGLSSSLSGSTSCLT